MAKLELLLAPAEKQEQKPVNMRRVDSTVPALLLAEESLRTPPNTP
jgi:hypothetical protein